MAWTEVGLAPGEYPKIAEKLRTRYSDWSEIDDIITYDVLGSFALESSLLPLAIVPVISMFMIAPFPDWGFDEDYLKARIAKWERIPRWRHALNPLRWFGYPIAWLMSYGVRRKLKKAFLNALIA